MVAVFDWLKQEEAIGTLGHENLRGTDGYSNDSSLDILYDAHESYMLDGRTAQSIIIDVTRAFGYWEPLAHKLQLPRNEMKLFASRFEKGMQWNHGCGLHR